MDFPHWHKPAKDVGAVLVHSQAELDAYGDWPNAAPDMTKAEIAAALKAKGVKFDPSHSKAALAEQLAAL